MIEDDEHVLVSDDVCFCSHDMTGVKEGNLCFDFLITCDETL